MANLNIQLSGATLQVIDNAASVQRVNSPLTALVGQVSSSYYNPYYLVANPGSANFPIPLPQIWQVWIRNISSANTISITCTPFSGAPWATPLVLVPNGLFVYMATYSANPSTGGIGALSLTSSGAATYAEILVAA